ncbi:MAG: hypothetical protein Q9207_000477 [Kuettlingeria erythrocarpa]
MDVVLEEPENASTVPSKSLPRNRLRRTSSGSQPRGWIDTSIAPTQSKAIHEAAAVDSDVYRHVLRRRTPEPAVIHRVQTIVDQMISSLREQDDDISISLRTKRTSAGSSSRSASRSPNDFYKISFPGNTPEEAWRFSTAALTARVCSRTSSMLTCSSAVVLRILELLHEALVTDMVISKRYVQTSLRSALFIMLIFSRYRNIYYKDPELFKSQTVVDRYVDILAYTFGIQRAALNVVSLVLLPPCINLVPLLSYSSAFQDRHSKGSRCGDIPDYASRRLKYLQQRRGRCLQNLQAKGYPDLSTRAFLRLLSRSSHAPLPAYALVDFDPDGIAIMSTYKHGSFTLSHESANLKTPTIGWLGLRSRDLHTEKLLSSSNGDQQNGMLLLSARDRKKAVKMLDKETYGENGPEQEWRRELHTMLMLNMKAEMEMLSERKGGVAKWVKERLCEERLHMAG